MGKYKTGPITLTADVARDLLRFNTDNRRLRGPKVKQFAAAMADGEWDTLADAGIALAELPDGSYRLLDGQHRLQAVVDSDATIDATLRVGRRDEDTARVTYGKIDQGSARNVADVLAELQFKPHDVSVIATALSVCEVLERSPHSFHNGLKALSTPARAAIVRANPDDAAWAFELRRAARGKMRELLTGYVAAAIGMHRVAPELADDFWAEVCNGELLARTDPTFLLRDTILRRGGTATGGSSTMMLFQRAQALAAWRAYCRRDSLTKIIVKASGTDLALVPVAAPRAVRG